MATAKTIRKALDELGALSSPSATFDSYERRSAWRKLVSENPEVDVFGEHASGCRGGAQALLAAVLAQPAAAGAAHVDGTVTSLGRALLAQPFDEVFALAEAGGSLNAFADLLLRAQRETFLANDARFFAAVGQAKSDGTTTRFIEILLHEHEGLRDRYAERMLELVGGLKKPYNQFIAGYLLLEAYGQKHAARARALLVEAMVATGKKGGSSDMIGLLDKRITGGRDSLKLRCVELLMEHFGADALDDIKLYHEENDALRLRYLRVVADKLGDAGAPILLSRGLFHPFDKRSTYGNVDYKTYVIRCLGILEGIDFAAGQKRVWKNFGSHATEKIREAAAAALAGLGAVAIDEAGQHLEAADAPTRTTAALVLVGVGTPTARALLEARLPRERSRKIKLLIEAHLADAPQTSAEEKAVKATKATKAQATKAQATKAQATKAQATKAADVRKAAPPTELGPDRNAGLEALLAEDPDDVERALVYGDWLQGRGHPRGMLITLQAAAAEAPDDFERAKAVMDFLRERDDVLFGFPPKKKGARVDVGWSLGFLRRARLVFETQDALLETLAPLLRHPSSCVLQRLTIEPLTGRGVQLDAERVVDLLLELGPPTLSQLSIGAPGQFRGDDRLASRFPRLARSADVLLAEARRREAEQRKVALAFDTSKLARLVPRDPASGAADDVPEAHIDNETLLRGLRLELDKKRPIGMVEAITAAFTRDSLDAFALSLLEAWRARGSRSADRWAFEAIGALGGERCAAAVGAELPELSHQRAVQGIEHLLRIGSDAAVAEVIGLWLTPSRYRPRRDAAEDALAGLAKARGLTLRDLLLRCCPRSSRGAVRARSLAVQRRWLEQLMIDGERLDASDFRDHLMHHALRAPLVEGLLFGHFDAKGQRKALFGVVDGQPVDVEGKALVVGDETAERIGVVHPLELAVGELDAWRARFAKQRLAQPFEQLHRPTSRLPDEEREAAGSKRFASQRVGFNRIREVLEGRDWSVYVQDHGIEAFARRFGRGGGVLFVADLRQNSGAIDELWATRQTKRGGFHVKRVALGTIDEVVISEALYDVETAVGPARSVRTSTQRPSPPSRPAPPPRPTPQRVARNTPSTSVEPGVLAQTGRYPFAELAKSGRAKCIVCGEAIPKGATRIGVERQIETPQFSGRATGWLHATCQQGCRELATVTDVEAALSRNSSGAWPPPG